MKNVCMIGTQFIGVPAVKGGAIEYLSFELAKGLAGKGFNVTYYSVLSEGREEICIKNLRIVRFPAKKVNGILFNLFVFFNALAKGFDLVYFSGCSTLPSAWLLAKIKGIPLIYHEFNHNPWVGGKNFVFDWLSRKSVKLSDVTVTPSNFIKRKIIELIPSAKKKLFAVHNSIDLKEFPKRMPEKKKRIVFVGRILEHKGLHYLIESMKELRGNYPEWALSIIGPKGEFNREDEGYYIKIKKMINDFELKEKVFFKGQLPRKELVKELSSASLLVLPSSEEAFGLVLVEAMASFTPCIAFDSGATREIIEDNKNGFLVENGNQKGLNNKIGLLAKNNELRRRFSLNARKAVEEKFSIEKCLKKWIGLIEVEPKK